MIQKRLSLSSMIAAAAAVVFQCLALSCCILGIDRRLISIPNAKPIGAAIEQEMSKLVARRAKANRQQPL